MEVATKPEGRWKDEPFVQRLRQRKEEMRLTNLEIAQRAGLKTGNVVSMILTGNMKLPIERTRDFARVFGFNETWMREQVTRTYWPGFGA